MARTDILTYVLPVLVDPRRATDALRAGGDVRAAVRADGESFLRTIADFDPASVSVAFRFRYEPRGGNGDPQGRLAISLAGQALRPDLQGVLSLLLERGPLRRFHDLRQVDRFEVDWPHYQAACDVVRGQSLQAPTVSTEFNAKALPAYYTVESFEPNADNDYLRLLSMLGRIEEPVLLEVCIEPADVAQELAAHVRYLSRLDAIAHTWGRDDEEPLLHFGGEEGSPGLSPVRGKRVELLREGEPLVDDVLRRQRRFHETLPRPHLRFHIRVFARTQAAARLIASEVAGSAFENGSYRLFDSKRGDPLFDQAVAEERGLRVVPVPAMERLLNGRRIDLYDGLGGLSNLAPVDELPSAVCFPVASYGSPCCIRKSTDPPYQDPGDMIVFGQELVEGVGPEEGATGGLPRGIPLASLTKHVFVSGLPGSGKTTSLLGLVIQLWNRGLPVIVFEPAKTEYRLLKCLKDHSDPEVRQLAEAFRVYRPGNELISPFRFNPLEIPPGISCEEHIEFLLNCLRAAMPMGGPLPAILGEALEEVYEEHPDPEDPPRMVDLYAAAERVLDSKGYSGEVDSNLRTALEVRIGLLTSRAIGRVFQCSHSLPSIDALMTGHSVVELSALPSEQACLLMLFLLTDLCERARTTPARGQGPRLVIVFEEAHNVVGHNTDAHPSEENADPKAFAAQFISQMLVELRALGVGIVIADQHASAVAPGVIKSTGTKLTFRQTDRGDREMLGESMLFGELEMEEVARFRPGEAYLYTEGYYGPRRIVTPNLTQILGFPSPPVGEGILPFIQDEPWFAEVTDARVQAELGQLRQEMDRFDARRLELYHEAAQLVAERILVMRQAEAKDQSKQLAEVAHRARALRDALRAEHRAFVRRAYRPLIGRGTGSGALSDSLKALHTHLVGRFASGVDLGTKSCLSVLDRLVADCTVRPLSTKGV